MYCAPMLLIYLLFVGYHNQQIRDISVTYEHSTSVGKYKNILQVILKVTQSDY